MSSPLRRERRKTVTFDEILDVQEFDKESSFDAESLRDADEHELATADGDFWMQDGTAMPPLKPTRELKVVNHDVEHVASFDAGEIHSAESEPDLSHDSHETSSIEGPPSPRPNDVDLQLHELSVDRDLSIHDARSEEPTFAPERENSLARLSAADRVDSMMDELLRDDILSSPSVRTRQLESSTRDMPEPLSIQTEKKTPSPTANKARCHSFPHGVPSAWTWMFQIRSSATSTEAVLSLKSHQHQPRSHRQPVGTALSE